jgi:hypothetical protein
MHSEARIAAEVLCAAAEAMFADRGDMQMGCSVLRDQDWMACTVIGPGFIPAGVPPSAYGG